MFPWHEKNWSSVEGAWRQGRLSHALLLEGPQGLGKGIFARRVAGLVLGKEALDPRREFSHPDLAIVTVPEGKKQITVTQIRELCASLAMTSHSSGHKVAIIDPAERMNVHAANSLLKTLEEPTDDTLLILVRSRLDTLPATIASRCQRLRFAIPAEDVSLSWLAQEEPGHDWASLLQIAGGAPLAAIKAESDGLAQLDDRLRQDLAEIVAGRRDPVRVAAEWSKIDPGITLAWLNGLVVALIRDQGNEPVARSKNLQNLKQVLPLEQLFKYLDEVQGALRRMDGALNLQMALESLLIPWASRLQDI